MNVKKTTTKPKKSGATKSLKSFKGFNPDLTCRGFQFEPNKTYKTKNAKACKSGFHACEYPLDCFWYYSPSFAVFHEVEQSGTLDRHSEDSKVASTQITIGSRLDIAGLVKATLEYFGDKVGHHVTGYESASSATGDQSASSATGDQSASSATGDYSASSSTGECSASSATGDDSASSATGIRSASSATGNYSASSATGYNSASMTTGDTSSSQITNSESIESKNSIAAGFGFRNKARATNGNWIVLAERDVDGNIMNIHSRRVGTNRGDLKSDTWYEIKKGKFSKVK